MINSKRSLHALSIGVSLTLGVACATPTPTQHVADDQPKPRVRAASVASIASAAPSAMPAPSVSAATASSVRPMHVKPGVEDTELKVDALGVFRVGARVRLKTRDRALDPEETGHGARLAYGPGQEGEIVRFLHRRLVKANAEFNVAVVRWDAQVWHEWDIPLNRMEEGKTYSGDDINRMNQQNGKPVRLDRFEAAAHPETLEWIGGTAKAEVAPSNTPDRGPTRSHCAPPLQTVAGSYVVFVHDGDQTQAIADDLKQRFKITIRRVWPALESFSAEMTPAQVAQLLKDKRLRDVQDNCR